MYPFGNFRRARIGAPRLPGLADGFEGILKVEKTFVEDTRFGPKFFCEFTVMSSNREAQNPVGQRVIWKQDLTKKDVADNAVLEWAAGVLSIPREDERTLEQLQANLDDPQQSILRYAVEVNTDQNNFTQRYVAARAHAKKTQNGRDFVAVYFFPYVG